MYFKGKVMLSAVMLRTKMAFSMPTEATNAIELP